MMKLRTALLAAALSLCAFGAAAQSSNPSPGGATVPLSGMSCLNSSGQAVPIFNAAGTWQCSGATLPTSATLSGTGANNADAVASVATGLISDASYPFVFNGATWDRLRGDATNGAFVQIKAMIPLPAGSNSIGTVLLPVTPLIASGNAVVEAVTNEAGQGTTTIATSALAANLVVNAAATNLHSFEVAADSTLSAAAWWVMIYNATTAPADGAVTPAKCYAMPSGTTAFSAAFPHPVRLGTGATIGVSTTGCFTKTASTHAFISGDFK